LVTDLIFAKSQPVPAGNPDDIVILRTVENSGMMASSMIVVNSDGSTEKGEIDKINTKNLESNIVKIHSKIQQIMGKGYELSMMSGGNSDGAICTTYVFKKRLQ
jgi:hypothetical protein